MTSFAQASVKKLIPLFDRVVVRRLQQQEKVQKIGSILLPENKEKTENTFAVVVSVGPKSIAVKEGDKVMLPEFKGVQLNWEGEKLDMYREEDILGIVKE